MTVDNQFLNAYYHSYMSEVLERLTPRERQVADCTARGLRDKEIGAELGIAPGTVKIHLKHAFGKLGANNRLQLALMVTAEGK